LKMLYDDLMLIFRNGCYYYLKRDKLIYDGCKGIQATLRRKLKTVGKQMGIENFESLKTYGTHYVPITSKWVVNEKRVDNLVVLSDSETPENQPDLAKTQ